MGQVALENALRNFGVTEKEAEVYIFLAKRGIQKTGYIAKQLRTNKGLVYRILKSLQKKGLVEATLEYPTRFTAVPFETVIDSFIKSKREEVARIEKTKKDLLSDWNRISQSELDSSLEKFSVIEGNKKIFHKISQMIMETDSQFSMALTVSDLFQAENSGIFDVANNRLQKSTIKFRVLTQLSKQNLKVTKNLVTNLKPIIDIRERNPSLGLPKFFRMAIRDEEEIILFISDKTDESVGKGKKVCLYTNCKSIIQAFLGVFDELWTDSIDIEERITEIETGMSPPKTEIIKDPMFAKKAYYEVLNSAKEEILIVTSSRGLISLLEDKLRLKEWVDNGVIIRVMAPITSENLKEAQQLLDYCEIKHVPIGYLETRIVDMHHLFQFKYPIENQKLTEKRFFENTFYTNDFDYVKKTKNMLFDIWRKTRAPSFENVRSTIRSPIAPSSSTMEHHPLLKKITCLRGVDHKQMEKITEEDVLDKIEKERKLSSKGHIDWFDTVRYFGSTAFAAIHPPKSFTLPDIVIGVFKYDKESYFGAENTLMISLWQKTEKGFYYVPVAMVLNTPEPLAMRKKTLVGSPAENNILVFKEDEITVQVKGNTLFAGWTKPIPLGISEYTLPPSCLLLEGYGDVKSGVFTRVQPSIRRQEVWYNSLDAFVSFFHPQSKYVGSGTEGFFDRETVLISNPFRPVNDS